jgi:hypothetical protein
MRAAKTPEAIGATRLADIAETDHADGFGMEFA